MKTETNNRLQEICSRYQTWNPELPSPTAKIVERTTAVERLKPGQFIVGLIRRGQGVGLLTFLRAHSATHDPIHFSEGKRHVEKAMSRGALHPLLDPCWDQVLVVSQEPDNPKLLKERVNYILNSNLRETIYFTLVEANDPRPKPFDPYDL